MLAHVEQVRHAHPHPAGVSWEVIALLIAVLAVAGALTLWWSVTRSGLRTARRDRPPTGTDGEHDHG